jgi:hypothetical protein
MWTWREKRERERANDMNEKGLWDIGGEGGEGETQARKEETNQERYNGKKIPRGSVSALTPESHGEMSKYPEIFL